MIPGTAKEVAALAIAHTVQMSSRRGGKTAAIATTLRSSNFSDILRDKQRQLRLAERRELVHAGELPGSSSLPFSIPLGDEMVVVNTRMMQPVFDRGMRHMMYFEHHTTTSVRQAIEQTVTGAHDLWFDHQGHAFVSVETDHERVMLTLALEGER